MSNYKDLNDYEIMYMISENDEFATNLLFTKYKPVIIKLAKEYYKIGKKYGLELEDFVQEGYCALFSAVKGYDMSRNAIFYTYAIICIKSKMNNLIIRNNTTKQKALNDSVSLYDNVKDTTLSLIEILGDKNSIIPDIEIETIELENNIKKTLYALKFEDSLACELKLNGFTNNDISILLDKSKPFISKAIKKFKKNMLILIEKNGL